MGLQHSLFLLSLPCDIRVFIYGNTQLASFAVVSGKQGVCDSLMLALFCSFFTAPNVHLSYCCKCLFVFFAHLMPPIFFIPTFVLCRIHAYPCLPFPHMLTDAVSNSNTFLTHSMPTFILLTAANVYPTHCCQRFSIILTIANVFLFNSLISSLVSVS